jgi:hypothetical protein
LVTQGQAIQCIRQIFPHGTHKPPHGAGNVHDTEDFLAINVLEGHLVGDLIFPSLSAVHALEKEFFVKALRHVPSGTLHPFVWTPFESVGDGTRCSFRSENENFTLRIHRQSVQRQVDGRFKPIQGLGNVTKGLIGHLLAFGSAIRANPKKNHAPGAI